MCGNNFIFINDVKFKSENNLPVLENKIDHSPCLFLYDVIDI